jgi:phage host-nuclease inhibitor protein Gam
MPPKHKTMGANLPVPQSRDEAAQAVRVIGDLNRDVARIELALNDEIAAMKQAAELKADPLRERARAMTEGLKIWAEANREALTGGKVKFADLGTGRISWRFRPASVRISKVEAVLDALRKLGLQRFIRVKEEPNREAMLADPDAARGVAGVSIGSEGEDFIVEPFEAELAKPAA